MPTIVVEHGHDTYMIFEAIQHFLDHNPNHRTTNLVKYARWWKQQLEIIQSFEIDHLSMNCSFLKPKKWVELKCGPRYGEGSPIVDYLDLSNLLRRFWVVEACSSQPLSSRQLLLVAKNALVSNPHPTFGPAMLSLRVTSGHWLIILMWGGYSSFNRLITLSMHQTDMKAYGEPIKDWIHVAFNCLNTIHQFEIGELNENLFENIYGWNPSYHQHGQWLNSTFMVIKRWIIHGHGFQWCQHHYGCQRHYGCQCHYGCQGHQRCGWEDIHFFPNFP